MIESQWPLAPLHEVTRFQEGPGILAKDFSENGIPLVRLSGLGGYEVTLKGCDFIDPGLVERRWNHFRLNRGDLLVSTSASFGRPAVVGEEAEGALFYTGLIRFRSSSQDLDEGYLKAFLGSKLFLDQAEAQASGSVISHFGPSHLRRMFVPVPPLRIQQVTAHTLGALDDKIDLNRRMSETLEAMTRAVFKDWFVDFGPTRAKMEGRAPYLAPDLWAMFPDRLDDEGKPEGWDSSSLDRTARFLNGLALQKFPADGNAGLPVIKIAQLRAGRATGDELASASLAADFIVRDGDLLFSWSGSLLHRIWSGGLGALNQHLFKVIPNGVPQWFVYQWIAEHMESFRAIAASKATTMGHIQRHHLAEAAICMPSPAAMSAADSLIAPQFARMLANDLESRTLAATRDLLLPKLMSGEVRIREAEKMMAAVA